MFQAMMVFASNIAGTQHRRNKCRALFNKLQTIMPVKVTMLHTYHFLVMLAVWMTNFKGQKIDLSMLEQSLIEKTDQRYNLTCQFI